MRDECRAERFSVGALTAWLGGRSGGAGHRGLLTARGDALGRGGRAARLGIPDLLHARNGGAARKTIPHARDAGKARPAATRRRGGGRCASIGPVGADRRLRHRAVTLDVVSGGRFGAGSSRPGCGAVSGGAARLYGGSAGTGPPRRDAAGRTFDREAMQRGVQQGLCYEIEGRSRAHARGGI